MSFINPLDILGIDPATLPDLPTLKKERRRRLLEFELADGEVAFGGIKVTRSDFIRATDELDKPGRVRLYHALQQLPALNRFITIGDLSYFRTDNHFVHLTEKIEEGVVDEQLVRLVSPHFAEQYGAALASAVRERDVGLVRTLTGHPSLIVSADCARADRPIDAVLSQIKHDLDILYKEVKEERLSADDAVIQARLAIAPDVLNALPAQFAPKRSQIARAVRHLGVAAFNAQDDVKSAFILLSDASRIDTSPDVTADIAQQLEVIRDIRDRRLLTEKYEDELAACAEMIAGLARLNERAESEDASPGTPWDVRSGAEAAQAILAVATGIRVDHETQTRLEEDRATGIVRQARELVRVNMVNSLPDELSDVRNHVAYGLRSLSITLWNEHQDAEAAQAILGVAIGIRVDRETQTRLEEDRATLARLQEENIAAEKKEVAVLGGIILSMVQTVTKHRGYQVRWNVVAQTLLDILSSEGVLLLIRARRHSANEVRAVLQALGPLLAGLHKYSRADYDRVVSRLKPLTANDHDLEKLVSPASLTARAQSDTAIRQATSDKQIWEYTWFWWVVILGGLFMLGQCGS